jgi:hypothetical protein
MTEKPRIAEERHILNIFKAHKIAQNRVEMIAILTFALIATVTTGLLFFLILPKLA